MRKELGKWLMDIAKYMTTALLLASVFNDMKGALTYISIIIATASTLMIGLWLSRNTRKEEK